MYSYYNFFTGNTKRSIIIYYASLSTNFVIDENNLLSTSKPSMM